MTKQYQFSEVMDFLRSNQDKVFDYSNPMISDGCSCLIASFFKSKGFTEGRASCEGNYLWVCDGNEPNPENILATIEGGPERIRTYHHPNLYEYKKTTGKMILKSLEEAGY